MREEFRISMDNVYRVQMGDGRRLHAIERDGEWHELVGDLFEAYEAGSPFDRASAEILPPIAPSKIVAVGLNYRDHAAEMGKALPNEPLIFLKPPSAVIGPEDAIVIPFGPFQRKLGRVIYT